jgi:hypothetical protein
LFLYQSIIVSGFVFYAGNLRGWLKEAFTLFTPPFGAVDFIAFGSFGAMAARGKGGGCMAA